MSDEEKYLEERVAKIREQMENAAKSAGRNMRDITLLAASKTQTAETVRNSRNLDIDLFGENRVQELTEKFDVGAYGDKKVHLIGHLQSNKVKNVVGKADIIQSVESVSLAKEISKQAKKLDIIQDILIEVNVGNEESKFGIKPEMIFAFMNEITQISNLRVRGIMSIPPISEKNGQNKRYFAILNKLFIDIRAKKYDNTIVDILSIGMSRDFCDAIAEGSNMVRIGTGIFGARNYSA